MPANMHGCIDMNCFINKYYRQGTGLLDIAKGFENLIAYKRPYPIRRKNRSTASNTQCYTKPFSAEKAKSNPEQEKKDFVCFLLDKDQVTGNKLEQLLELYGKDSFNPPDRAYRVLNAARERLPEKNLSDALRKTVLKSAQHHIHTKREMFERLDIAESILKSQNQFTMIDAGAGHGRSITTAWAMIQCIKGSTKTVFTAVEADPDSVVNFKEHTAANGVECNLVEKLLSDREGTEGFLCGSPAFGAKVTDKNYVLIKTCLLDSLLCEHDCVDLLLLDVRQAESRVVHSSTQLCAKVRKVHIDIHNAEGERQVRQRFDELNWINVWDFAPQSVVKTPFGPINFVEGIQTWINPRFF